MSEARELAESFSEAARKNYEQDGELVPIISLRGGNKDCIIMMQLENNAPQAVGVVLAGFGALLKPQYAVFVSETWSKSFKTPDGKNYDPARPPPVTRGQLAKMHEAGDMTVHTSLLVSAWDLVDLSHSVTILQDADDGFRREDIPGPGNGAVADMVGQVVKMMPTLVATMPANVGLSQVLAMARDYVSGVAIEWDEDEPIPEGAERLGTL
jgi:hypothetical protein